MTTTDTTDAADPGDAHFRDDLDATLARAWALLARGAADRRSGFHTVQFASLAEDGGPRVRTVVLRGVAADRRMARVHTDRRSAKAAELARDPRVELCAYDARLKVQMRLRGVAVIQAEGPAADAAWAGSQLRSRACYRAALGPGALLARADEADPDPAPPASPDAGRENFVALCVVIDRIEWLYLAAAGHRRAAYVWGEGVGWRGRWLAP